MKHFSKLLIVVFFLGLGTRWAMANEGMWLPLFLSQLNEKEMKAMGMKISADDIYNINKGSLKDAVISFGGFCTGGVVSNQGLIFTNHHCGYGSIQALSTIEHNYLNNGYWAKELKDELPAQGLSATFIVRIEDVTKDALNGVADTMSEALRQSTIDKNLSALRKGAKKEAWQDVMIRPFFDGNQYFLFVTETYRDVRFVGAPPSSIGKFGNETDNWVWPRHTCDFSVFRIYANKDNKPAEYSADNVPYKPKYALSISMDGVKDGEFNMIMGFPGRTQEYLPSFAIEQIMKEINPARIEIRGKALKILDEAMRADEKIKLQYASKYSVVANYYKKWRGENLGLKNFKVVEKKHLYEEGFQAAVNANPDLSNKYGSLLRDFKKMYGDLEPYAKARNVYSEVFGTNSEILSMIQNLDGIVTQYEKAGEKDGEKLINDRKPRLKGSLDNFYKDYQPELDKKVLATLLEYYFTHQAPQYITDYAKSQLSKNDNSYAKLADKLFSKSIIAQKDKMMQLLDKEPKKMVSQLKDDPAYKFAKSLIDKFNEIAVPKLRELQPQINKMQRLYMKAQMDALPYQKFYPDANSTLRVSYGKINGYMAKDAVQYTSQTYLDGVMEKYVPNDYEFDVPEKLRKLYEKKDFGQYTDKTGRVPVCFLSSGHTTGGNSGSPALDANGNLVGLLFDGSWEGLMSDLSYDEAIVRSIVVDVRYLLFIIDKYGDCKRLVDEVKLVKSK